ncbi:hypothetical protein JOE53_000637 [Microbacterium laevaniformans]|uniref:hypothetical protein n=1 Tax=Microbacterium laevaniformans TaxID=36807 RepID=UPI001D66BB5A|nr:hypothetical protein [Microbacterium laevaniformans]MBM7751917.1 hypothetical protein [Microbacterium laevaniformans]
MPHRSTSRRVRALRGTTAAAIATTIASTGHTLGGGQAPPLWLIVAVTVLASPVAVALVGRRRSLLRTAAAIAAAQIALHTMFAVIGPASLPAAGTGHVHGALSIGPAVAGSGHSAAHLGVGMLLAHALAAVVTIALVAYGERLVAVLARGIRRVLNRTHSPAPQSFPWVVIPSPGPRVARADAHLSVLTRRGPPAFAR